MRSLGAACHALTSLNISQAKLVSDIGIASLSSGCPRLTKLSCSAIFLLSDPRLSIPKKGEKPAAWQNVIGVAAIAKNCSDLEHLEFANCFRLDISINRYVSILTKLKSLNLAGCLEVSSESLIAMAEGCVLLEELNLSDCTKAATTAALKAIGTHCKEMRSLTLARCEDVKGGVINGIVLCMKLEKLDLNGCKNLTDDMLMPLSDASTLPKLKHLSMVGIVTVTDRTLSWMASKVHNIQYFALKGTSVRRSAFKSVRDSFALSELVLNENFSGFWPKSRIEDRNLIKKYGQMITGYIALQARLRGYMARMFVLQKRRLLREAYLMLVVQCAIRQLLARIRLRKMREEHYRQQQAATMVNTFFRMVRAMKIVAQRKAELYRQFVYRMMLRIQSLYRRYRAKCELNMRKEKRRLLRMKRNKAALEIQCFARMIFAKTRVAHIKQMNRSRHELEQRKTLMIQRVFRGSLGRTRVAEIWRMKQEWIELCERQACKIQYAVRRMWIARILEEKIKQKRLIQFSARQIQRMVRGLLARLMVGELVSGLEAANMDEAATKLQYAWLRKKAHLEVRRRIIARDKLIAYRHATAITIQKHVRSMWARMTLAALKEEAKDFLRAQAELEIWAAIKIQACWRGMHGRMHFDDVVRERKGLWKELFDEEKKKRFFYNKLTGEIRWKIPQDLLDLLPRPKCDNCGFYEASVECAICNEFFCSQCWDQVHYGGRRKTHEFRALYDYYGKRLDYGDDTGESNDEWPSKWPSDIVSDEVHGWMLRVAPVRAPLSVMGAWEEYAAEEEPDATDAQQQQQPVRTFYFNRSTFEATYDKPYDLLMPPVAPSQTYDGGQYTHTHYDQYGNQHTHGSQLPQLTNRQYNQEPGFTIARSHSEYQNTGNSMNRTYSDKPAVDQQQWMDEQQQQQEQGYYDAEGNWINDDFSYMFQSKGGGVTSFKR